MVVILVSTLVSALVIFAIAFQAKQDSETRTYKFYGKEMVALITVNGDVDKAFELSKTLMVSWQKVERINTETGKASAVIFDNTNGEITEEGKTLTVLSEVK